MRRLTLTICINLMILHLIGSTEYGLLFEHEESYLQTGYLTLCDECVIKVEFHINRTSGILMYAENRVRAVSLVVYFDRPGVYANVTEGTVKYNLPLTMDFFSNEWFGWHELEIQISESKMHIMIDNTVRQATLKGKFLFPENVVEENEIYFGASPRWSGIKNVHGFVGFMKNFMYKSCGCEEWRAMEIVNMVGVSRDHLGDCRSVQSCKDDCSCYLFPWGGRRCECPDLQCLQKSNDVSYDFDRNSLNLGRLQNFNDSNKVVLEPGVHGEGMVINESSSAIFYVATGRSCFKNIFLCEKGFTHSFWIMPKVTNHPMTPTLIFKHSSTLGATHGLTVLRVGNTVKVSLITHEGIQYNVESPLQLSIWSLMTTVFNKTHLSLYQNFYLKEISKRLTKINSKFPELASTRFLFVGNYKDNPDILIDNFNFTYNVNLPKLSSIQELRLEQHSSLRKLNLNCEMTVENTFVDLTQCYKSVFRDYNFTEFYLSLIFNLKMEKKRMILLRSSYLNITTELHTALHIDLRGESTIVVKLKLVANRLYYVEISMNSEGKFIVRQNINTVLLNVSLDKYVWSAQKRVTEMLVNNDRNALTDVRFINVNREFATTARRIITGDVSMYSMDFDHNNIENHLYLQLTEGYIDQGLALKHPNHFVKANWFSDGCFRYTASCYHGFTFSFWMKIINNFHHLNEPYFKLFSTGNKGVSLIIGKEGLYFILIVESQSITKFIPSPSSFELYQWCFVELTLSSNGIASLFLNGREAQRSATGDIFPSYKCSQICIRDEDDKETFVTMIVDEIKTWNVERDFLYANGYLSSNAQSLLQQQKNYENKIKELKEFNISFQKERKEMEEKLQRLKIELTKLKKELKSSACKPLNDVENLTKLIGRNQTYDAKYSKVESKDNVNESVSKLKNKCFEAIRKYADNNNGLSNDSAKQNTDARGKDKNKDRGDITKKERKTGTKKRI